MIGGEAGIRTLGGLPLNGFQDRRFRPLSHLSITKPTILSGGNYNTRAYERQIKIISLRNSRSSANSFGSICGRQKSLKSEVN